VHSQRSRGRRFALDRSPSAVSIVNVHGRLPTVDYIRGMVRAIAAISFCYDLSVGLALVFLRPQLQAAFGVAAPQPPIHVDLNALFLICVGAGYVLPYRDPVGHRAYMWIFGVALKAGGAAAFILDYVVRGSPRAFLLFAASDGALALASLAALTLKPPVDRNA
jgi:hypothetical protein